MSRARYAYEYYLRKGLSPQFAAGLVGNFQVESGFADDVLSGKRRGDQGSAHGLAQWRHGRFNNLQNYAKQRGQDWRGNLDLQLDFALEEFNPNSPYRDKIAAANRHKMMQAGSPQEAAKNIMRYYERASPNPKYNHLDRRISTATSLYGQPASAKAMVQPVAQKAATQQATQQAALQASLPTQPVAQQLAATKSLATEAAKQAATQQMAQAATQQAATQAAAKQAAAVPASPLSGIMSLMSMMQAKKPQQVEVQQDAVEPMHGGIQSLQEDMDPHRETRMTAHTPYADNRRRRRFL